MSGALLPVPGPTGSVTLTGLSDSVELAAGGGLVSFDWLAGGTADETVVLPSSEAVLLPAGAGAVSLIRLAGATAGANGAVVFPPSNPLVFGVSPPSMTLPFTETLPKVITPPSGASAWPAGPGACAVDGADSSRAARATGRRPEACTSASRLDVVWSGHRLHIH